MPSGAKNTLALCSASWKMGCTGAGGLCSDAEKHSSDDFFGDSGAVVDQSHHVYTGRARAQLNLIGGISYWDIHRDSVFDADKLSVTVATVSDKT